MKVSSNGPQWDNGNGLSFTERIQSDGRDTNGRVSDRPLSMHHFAANSRGSYD